MACYTVSTDLMQKHLFNNCLAGMQSHTHTHTKKNNYLIIILPKTRVTSCASREKGFLQSVCSFVHICAPVGDAP